jgi:hypothetical protein
MSSLVMVVAGLCCGQFYLAAGIRQDPACGRFWHLGDCDRVTGNPEITFWLSHRRSILLTIIQTRNCQFGWLRGSWKLLKGRNFLVAGGRFELTTFGPESREFCETRLKKDSPTLSVL